MIFKDNAPLYATEIERKQGESILYVNYLKANFVPSIADSPEVMVRTMDALSDNTEVSAVVFVQQRNYHYPSEQVLMLAEIISLYNFLVKQEAFLSIQKLSMFGNVSETHADLVYLLNYQFHVLSYSILRIVSILRLNTHLNCKV